MTEIAKGSRVRMHYSITLEDGTLADSSFEDEPLELTIGDGVLNPGLEQPLYGMSAGDEKTITLSPEQAFGYHDADNIHDMPLDDFDSSLQPEYGKIIGFTTPAGDEIAGMVIEVTKESVRVDFNHPLAGHDLVYQVKILGVE